MALSFPEPNKTTCAGDASEFVTWTDLPIPTHVCLIQVMPDDAGAHNDFDVTSGRVSESFNPPGEYTITLSAEGYETRSWTITAV